MAAPTTTSSLTMQDFFSTTLSSAISSSDTVIPLNAVPTGTEGFLVIDQDNSSKEIIYYNTKGGSSVTVPNVSTGRGQGGTSAVSHLSGATVKLNVVSQYWTELQNGDALNWGAGAKLTGGPAWAAGTPAGTGFASKTSDALRWQQIGKTVFCVFNIAGTSNTTAFGFTLPVAAKAADTVGQLRVSNNGAFLTTPGYIATTAGSATAVVFSNNGGGLWTGSSTKSAEGTFHYEAN